jgi:hypothetical protein
VQAGRVVAARGERHRDQRVHRARRADRLHRPGAPHAQQQVSHLALEMALERADLSRRGGLLGKELLRQPCYAQRQTAHPERPAVLRERQLDAAAPHVDQQMGTALEPECVTRGPEDQPRLLRAGDDLDGQPRFAP